jgi:chromosome partitioning protein
VPDDGLELVDLTPDGMPRDTPDQRHAASAAAAGMLEGAIPRLAKSGHDILIVDTPPAPDRIVSMAIASADLVIVPVRPSPDDLDPVGETVDLATAAKKPMVFVVNSATRKANLTSDAAIALSQHGTVSPAILHRADAYASSALDGRTVSETDPKGKPAEDVAALWAYVGKRLGLQACKLAGGRSGWKASKAARSKAAQEA